MKTATYTVRFTTQAFLGNAEQSGQWRTPPFKALLRQWWRVAVAREFKYNVDTLREREHALFGTVEGKARKSQVRIRLSRWDDGQATAANWPADKTTKHPKVSKPVGAQLYLGYGPLIFSKGKGTALKKAAAIQAGEQATLSLAFPDECADAINTALWLMHQYGTLGGRSRNGWGSFSLAANDGALAPAGELNGQLTRDWHEALTLDWPHAVGVDQGKPLIWQTGDYPDWNSLMVELARLKIGLRTQFTFHSGKNAPDPEARHWLSYPVTHHSVGSWKEQDAHGRPGRKDFRLPNSLRFKLRQDAAGKLRGVIFHVPCLPPAKFHPDRRAIEQVWQRVHEFLDDPSQNLSRIPA